MKFPKNFKLILAILLLFGFVLLSKFEDRAFIRNMDFAVTVKIQDRIDKSVHLRLAAFVDNIMEGSSFFAEPFVTSVAVLLLTIFGYRKYKWRALGIPIAFALVAIIEVYGKSVVHHPSPPFAMIKHPTSIFPANYINEQFSYPSGHAARAVFVAVISWFIFNKKRWMALAMAGYVLLVVISKIYLGQHWLSDIAGGALLGAGLGSIIAIL